MPEERVSLSQPGGPTPGDPGYIPPTDAVPLPSRGLVYPVGSPLHGVDRIEIRSMTARDENILTSRALIKQGRAISALLASCIVDKRIDVDGMLVGDRNAAMVAIRITGYGAGYETTVDCPACDDHSVRKFDLSRLPIRPLGAVPTSPGTNEFTFRLPSSGREVVFKLLTGADERDLSVSLDRLRKVKGGDGVDPEVTLRLQYSIVAIAGDRDGARLANAVPNLPAMDARALRKHIDAVAPGVEMVQEMECSSCHERMEVQVPIGTEFFWPR